MTMMISVRQQALENRLLFGDLHCLMSEAYVLHRRSLPGPLGSYRIGIGRRGYTAPPDEMPVGVISYVINTALIAGDMFVKFGSNNPGLRLFDVTNREIARWDGLGHHDDAAERFVSIDLAVPSTDSVEAWVESLLLAWDRAGWLNDFLVKSINRFSG